MSGEEKNPNASVETAPPITKPPTVDQSEPGATTAPLPPPAALTDVISRIADAGVPGIDKLNLVESATPEDAAAMDRFGRALADGGYTPVTFEATELTWAEGAPGKVLAVVAFKTANPQAGDFRFPMEFSPIRNGWQLTRRTADALLYHGENPVPAPTPTPPP